MTTLLLERSPVVGESFEYATPRRRLDGARLTGEADANRRLTLDELITGAWEDLAVHGTVNCPVCESPMAFRSANDEEGSPTGACVGCGSRLS
jgi:hypothetical protein